MGIRCCKLRDDELPHGHKPGRLVVPGGVQSPWGLLSPSLRHPESPGDKAGFLEEGKKNEPRLDSQMALWATISELKKLRQVMEDMQRTQALEIRSKATGKSAIELAAAEGDLETVKFLVSKIRLPVSSGDTIPLCIAAENGHLPVVKWLCCEGKADVNEAGEEGRTPLLCAARGGHVDIVKFLLDDAKALMWEDKAGFTPLHHALDCEDEQNSFDVVKSLVERKADVNQAVDPVYGNTFLMHFIAEDGCQHPDLLNFLIFEAKADVNQKNNQNGQTALMVASGCLEHIAPNFDLVKSLVEKANADMMIEDNESLTAADHAREEGHMEISEYLGERMLQEGGINRGWNE
mmetsp:Transcript_16512/g.23099  ORF Transcript_16512/g.23099 Transcript_16512/m.23099 type:complete len:349 (+) Transcript_16512:38-1084(+)|eukprot:CAMPEP_0184496346 /NCGR_PEP_ID=MMETSP0113_2-20130426/33719_1 /TAXON_ID=91329 /ORGANISM="Norrisiella sphaerica, Strain BC52" /LENGTH=348 /DNA_ID=CAMNT_0026882931 /DNA_START=251 /DNA_END=1297 /DNA_ORIENTATION=-